MLLEIDESRLPKPVVWEQGDPPDPGGMLFPHVYEPIPVAAEPPAQVAFCVIPVGITQVPRKLETR